MFLIENPTTFQYEQITDKLIEVINASGICNYGEHHAITGPELLHMADSLSEWLGSQPFEDAPIPDHVEDTPEAIAKFIVQENELVPFDHNKRKTVIEDDRKKRFKTVTDGMKFAYETGRDEVSLYIRPGINCLYDNSQKTIALCEEEAKAFINQEVFPRGFRVISNTSPKNARWQDEYYNLVKVGFK